MRKLTYFVASTLDGFIAAGWPVTLLPELDELVIKLYPIVIGSGVPMFAGEFGPYPFTMADSRCRRTAHELGIPWLGD